MGTWGAGVFSDDLACDVRQDYRDAIKDGATAAEAKEMLLKRYAETINDPDEAAVYWLALATTAWQLGQLDSDLKEHALGIIERNEGMDRWDNPKLRRAREAALKNLADTLRQPQRAPVKLKKTAVFITDWRVGEVIGFQQRSGKWNLLHVVGLHSAEQSEFPIINLLDWNGTEVPPNPHSVQMARAIVLPLGEGLGPRNHFDVCLLLTPKIARDPRFARWEIYLERRKSPLE